MNDRGVFSNAPSLAAKGAAEARALALRVAAAGLEACDSGRATEQAVALTERGFAVAGREYPLEPGSRVVIVGSGKATLAIAKALEHVLGERLWGGVVAVRDGADALPMNIVEVLCADHPLPTDRSQAAALRMLELVDAMGEGDVVIAAFTGGSSALTSLPPAGVTQAEKRRLHELLLASGAPIAEVNTVRKHVSSFKGGRLAARVGPALLVNLAVSDVAGDVLDVLTDPSVQDTTTADQAIEVLKRRDLWQATPASVRSHLSTDAARSPHLAVEPQTVLLVSGAAVCRAMAAEAHAADAASHVVSTSLEGDAVGLGRLLAEMAVRCATAGEPATPPCVLVGCGGEATVTLGADGSFGAGGPNQEAALAAALGLEGQRSVAVCFIDTDGSDGGTDVAGAMIDGLTAERARRERIDLPAALALHRSGDAVAALGDAIITGPTHTNVNDLFVVALVPDAQPA